MRTIEWTSQFKRDFKRESKSQHRSTLDNHLFLIIERLAHDEPLAARYHDPGQLH